MKKFNEILLKIYIVVIICALNVKGQSNEPGYTCLVMVK